MSSKEKKEEMEKEEEKENEAVEATREGKVRFAN